MLDWRISVAKEEAEKLRQSDEVWGGAFVGPNWKTWEELAELQRTPVEADTPTIVE